MEMWSPYASNYDNPIRYNDFLGDEPYGGPGDPIKQVGLVTGREYTLTAPTGIGSAFKFAGQYIAGTANELIAGINQNLNPVYLGVNGAQALVTGKDIQTGQPMNTGDAAMSVAAAIPVGKVAGTLGKLAGAAEGMVVRGVEKATVTDGAKAMDGVSESLKTATPVKNEAFVVTREGVVLPKGAKIPKNFVENPHRSANYGVIENGKYVEKVRIDPPTPSGKKGPNYSHFHLNGGSDHLIKGWPWWQ